jgi:hypothetical protein
MSELTLGERTSDFNYFGSIGFRGADMGWRDLLFDMLAITEHGQLLLASVIAPSEQIKGIRAALNTDKPVTIDASGPRVKRAGDGDLASRDPGKLTKLDGGYLSDIHHLSLGLAHGIYRTKIPGFLIQASDAHLWAALMGPARYTTPLLPAWLSYVRRELVAGGLLKEALCYNCECGLLTATDKALDEIVSKGLRTRAITIPKKSAA